MAEFAYNNGYQESIKHTLFFANCGVNPEHQTIGHLMQGHIRPPENMSQLHNILKAEMTEAQLRHKEYYDAGRKPDPNLQSGDMVWLLPKKYTYHTAMQEAELQENWTLQDLGKDRSNRL